MNDRQDPYAHDPYAQPPQVYGYDAYGRPVYHPDDPQRVYDAYGQPLAAQQQAPYDPYAAQQAAPRQTAQQEWIPQQQAGPAAAPPQPAAAVPEPRRAPDGADAAPDHRTEQFSFVEAPDEDSEDVIDWLKFTESRTERRDERKRKGRNRFVALAVALVLVVGAVVGWLLLAGGDDGGGPEAAAGQKRDVIVVHLRQTKGGGSSTALLVDNATTKKATAVLLPNSLAVTKDGGGSTTLGKSVQDAGTGATRDALNTLLGSQIKGSWRLDTPYLENLVQLVGGITVDADTDVPGAKAGDNPLVRRGGGRTLNGQTAVAYATYRGPGEEPDKQLLRFGQVMQAVLKKLSSDGRAATTTVETLAQIPDPSLSVQQLGASLAQLAERAKADAYRTALLPVRQDGTLGGQEADGLVKEVLGGAVKNAGADATPRVGVRNATGGATGAGAARVALVNGGYTFLDAGTAPATARTAVLYADDKRAADAKEVAKTLGLPAGAVRKGGGSDVAANADITVVLGRDYKG
ncbi:LCP family protein [Streptomyces sp. AV19]|uniref:LCP family protein n=1 Tax=Streptomyces sp. AV19 TaxID=2793068 RepID=UPI0018FE77EA|nr:LCP family protein [Streptomyces sp. AV19]MBH1933133.1 LCP family protein [Streptomyces sp. AV19]MDG4531847.1 LCP family protein [Streptomyces sp. AV19]